jgi:hypothetical protein
LATISKSNSRLAIYFKAQFPSGKPFSKVQFPSGNLFQSPVPVWQFISKSSSRLAIYFKAQFPSGNLFQSPVLVWQLIPKSSSRLANYIKNQFLHDKSFAKYQFSSGKLSLNTSSHLVVNYFHQFSSGSLF